MTPLAATEKVLSPAKLAHVGLRTSQYKPMISFYRAFLGAEVVYENDFIALLTYDEEHHRVAITNMPGTTPKEESSAGVHHFCFTFNTLKDLLQAYSQRKTRGILPWWCLNHGTTTSMFYLDPDGNWLETQVDNFDTSEQTTAFMASLEFKENSIGVDFDPEDFIRRLENGEDENAIKRERPRGPRGLETVPVPPKPLVRENYDVVSA